MRRPRLPVETARRLLQTLSGDPVTEVMVLRFMEAKWGAKSLFDLPPNVASEILRRPVDFIRAAKRYCQPELPF
jgi:hypothetical protein